MSNIPCSVVNLAGEVSDRQLPRLDLREATTYRGLPIQPASRNSYGRLALATDARPDRLLDPASPIEELPAVTELMIRNLCLSPIGKPIPDSCISSLTEAIHARATTGYGTSSIEEDVADILAIAENYTNAQYNDFISEARVAVRHIGTHALCIAAERAHSNGSRTIYVGGFVGFAVMRHETTLPEGKILKKNAIEPAIMVGDGIGLFPEGATVLPYLYDSASIAALGSNG